MLKCLPFSDNHAQKFGQNQKKNNPQTNLLHFGARTPATADKLIKSAETAVKKGEIFKGMDYFTKAVKKAEQEVAQGQMTNESFADICVNVSKKLFSGCVEAFNKSFETAEKALNAGKGNKAIEQKASQQLATLDHSYVATQNALNSIASSTIQQYEAMQATQLNRAAQKLEAEKIYNELEALKEIEAKKAKQLPIGFHPQEKVTPAAAKEPKKPLNEAAAELREKQIKMALEADKELKEKLAKKQDLGFIPPTTDKPKAS